MTSYGSPNDLLNEIFMCTQAVYTPNLKDKQLSMLSNNCCLCDNLLRERRKTLLSIAWVFIFKTSTLDKGILNFGSLPWTSIA